MARELALVRVGALRDRRGRAGEEAVWADFYLGGRAGGGAGGLLREGWLGGLELEVARELEGELVHEPGAQARGQTEEGLIQSAVAVAERGATAGDDGGVDQPGGRAPANCVVLGAECGAGLEGPVEAGEVDGLVGAAGGLACEG